jgi:hypothetical protein
MNRPRIRLGSRRGISVLELVMALAVLALGIIPLFQMLRQSRGVVGASRQALVLESHAMQGLAEAEALVHDGHFEGLASAEEEVLVREEGDVRIQLVVTRIVDWKLFQVRVRAEGPKRFFELAAVVSDPLASIYDREVPEADREPYDPDHPIPDLEIEHEEHRHAHH